MIITWKRVVRFNLTKVPLEDLLAEIQRRITLPPPAGEPIIPPPLRREQVK